MMPKTNLFARATSRLMIALTTLALAIGIGGCAKQSTEVDPGFFPAGKLDDDARMVLWFDQPNVMTVYADFQPLGPDPLGDRCGMPVKGLEDTLLGYEERQFYSPGTVRGMIIDHTPASSYQLFRREASGGFRMFQDFPAERFRQWLFTGWEAFRFIDRVPSGMNPATYVGRGVVDGTVTPQSPLTNAPDLALPTVPEVVITSLMRPRDSLFTVTWDPVASAAGYWVQIYDLPPVSPNEAILRGAPAPFFDGDANEIFVGFVDAPSTTYTIGDTSRTDVDILMRRATFFSRIYIVRVSAVDAGGQMLATTRGSNGILLTEGMYALFPLGGRAVCPTPPNAALESEIAGETSNLPSLLANGQVAWRVPHLSYRPK